MLLLKPMQLERNKDGVSDIWQSHPLQSCPSWWTGIEIIQKKILSWEICPFLLVTTIACGSPFSLSYFNRSLKREWKRRSERVKQATLIRKSWQRGLLHITYTGPCYAHVSIHLHMFSPGLIKQVCLSHTRLQEVLAGVTSGRRRIKLCAELPV